MGILELLIVVVLLMWLLGYFGGRRYVSGPTVPTSLPPFAGSWIHTLLVIVLILIVLRLLGVRF